MDTIKLKLDQAAKTLTSFIYNYRWLLSIFTLGILIRLFLIHLVPPGLNQDEASIGYDAYAIMNYSIDHNHIEYPVHLIAWGSGQNALYAYLSMPFIALFGLEPLSIRAVNLLFGVVSLLVMYGLSRRLVAQQNFALVSMFLLAISPWHIMLSRWALESNIFPAFVLLAVYCLLLSLSKQWYYIISCFIFAISLYAYGTSYFFVPVFLLVTTIYWLVYKKLSIRYVLYGFVTFIVTALPILMFVIINRFQLNTIKLGWITIPRLTGTPRFDQVSSVFHNPLMKIWENGRQFFYMLFTQQDGLIWNSISPFGILYPIFIPLLLIGLGKAIVGLKRREWNSGVIMLIWFTVAFLMAFVTEVNINRMNILFIPAIYFAAYGVWALKSALKWSFVPIITVFTVSFVLFTNQYFTKFPEKISASFYESLGDAIEYASDVTDGAIEVTGTVNMPYIFVLFYEKIDPNLYFETVKITNPNGAFQYVESFDRYYFGDQRLADQQVKAFVIPNHTTKQYDPEEFHIEAFKNYSVAVRRSEGHFSIEANIESTDQDVVADSFTNVLVNGSFEEEGIGWQFTGVAGYAYNRPYQGIHLAYIDAGSENRISQFTTLPESANYQFSGFVSAGGEGGKVEVIVNGQSKLQFDLPIQEEYVEISGQFYGEADAQLEVSIVGGSGWINIDEFSIASTE